MNKKAYFEQLGQELEHNRYKKRFLDELQDHAQDMEEDTDLKEELAIPNFFPKRLGQPEQVGKTFKRIMNPWQGLQTISLFGFSFYSLSVAWGAVLNTLFMPWQVSPYYPSDPLIAQMHHFFQSGGLTGIYVLLLGMSLLLVLLRLKKLGKNAFYQILDYAAISNFFYLALLIVFSYLYILIVPAPGVIGYNLVTTILHFSAIGVLFYIQGTGFMIRRKPNINPQKIKA